MQDFELFRVFDSLAFEKDDVDKNILEFKHKADLDGDQTQVAMYLDATHA